MAIALTVSLYPDGPEWTCDCEGKTDPCAHVAAAAIAAGVIAIHRKPLRATRVARAGHAWLPRRRHPGHLGLALSSGGLGCAGDQHQFEILCGIGLRRKQSDLGGLHGKGRQFHAQHPAPAPGQFKTEVPVEVRAA